MLLLPALTLAIVSAAPPKPAHTKPVLLHTLTGHTSTLRGVCFSPDSKQLATACDGGTLTIWDVVSGKSLATTRVGGMASVDYSRDGKFLITGGNDGTARMFDASTAKELKTFTGLAGQHYVARFTPDGKYVVASGSNQQSRIWEVSSGKEVRNFNSGVSYGMGVSPDGKFVVTGGDKNAVTLFNLETGNQVRQMTGHTNIIVWVSFTSDSRLFATCGYDASIRLWETKTGKERLKITAITNSPRCNMFSGDGRFLAACAYDYTVRLFDTETGKEVFNANIANTSLYAVAVSPDGQFVCSGGGSGKLQVWDVSAVTRKKAEEAKAMEASTFDNHWKDLGSEDGTEAHKAVIGLSNSGSLKHFASHFAPPKPLTDEAKKKTPQLIKDLEDDDKWKKASDEFASFGVAILPILRAALEKEGDPDVKLRLIVTIRRCDTSGSEEMRMARAIEVLERIGSAAAIAHLETLAKGAKGDTAAAEAKVALARLRLRE